jgi:hypothetical protein
MSFRVSQTIDTYRNKIVRSCEALPSSPSTSSISNASSISTSTTTSKCLAESSNDQDLALIQKITQRVSDPSFFISSSNQMIANFNERIKNKKVMYDAFNQQWKLFDKGEDSTTINDVVEVQK